jgi:hypothetical protein
VSRLFIELYLDEDVDVLVTDLLRARGFVADTTRDAGLLGAGDAAQLEFAAQNGYALFTHNRDDFETLARNYFSTGQSHYGIIIAVRRLPHQIVRRLLIILNQVTADEMRNDIRYI